MMLSCDVVQTLSYPLVLGSTMMLSCDVVQTLSYPLVLGSTMMLSCDVVDSVTSLYFSDELMADLSRCSRNTFNPSYNRAKTKTATQAPTIAEIHHRD